MPITLNGTTGITDADGGTVLSSADLASQAEAEAGADNTKVMTPLRAAQAITARVGAATAGLALGAVGTYAFLAHAALTTGPINAGSTVAGSSLRYAGFTAAAIAGSGLFSNNPASTTAPSGTWMQVGETTGATSLYRATLFLRIS
jgi:hypothetical protein